MPGRVGVHGTGRAGPAHSSRTDVSEETLPTLSQAHWLPPGSTSILHQGSCFALCLCFCPLKSEIGLEACGRTP